MIISIMVRENIIEDICMDSNVLILSPHPDDEVIGCSVFVKRMMSNTTINIAYLTNGVCIEEDITADLLNKYHSYNNYVSVRLSEKKKALKKLNCHELGHWDYPSRTLVNYMDKLYIDLYDIINLNNISILLSPPYEGAHPDHDIVNCISYKLRKIHGLKCIEYQCYNRNNGSDNYQKFLDSKGVINLSISSEEELFKKDCLSVYQSQNILILNNFSPNKEAFRIMPDYNYNLPPVIGETFYENWKCGISASQVSEMCIKLLRL